MGDLRQAFPKRESKDLEQVLESPPFSLCIGTLSTAVNIQTGQASQPRPVSCVGRHSAGGRPRGVALQGDGSGALGQPGPARTGGRGRSRGARGWGAGGLRAGRQLAVDVEELISEII